MRSSLSEPASPSTLNFTGVTVSLMLPETAASPSPPPRSPTHRGPAPMRSSLSDPASPSTLNSQGVTVSLMLAERATPIWFSRQAESARQLYAIQLTSGVTTRRSSVPLDQLVG